MKICYRIPHYCLLLSPARRVFKSYACTVPCYCDIHCRRYSVGTIYRVIRKSLWNFRNRLRNNQDRHSRVDILSTFKVGQKLGLSLLLLTCSPSAWPSRLLYRRGQKSRRDLWITLYYAGNVMSHDNVLYVYISTARIKCADLNVALSCGYFMSCFPAKLFRNFLSDFEIVLVAPIIKLINTIIDL